MKQKSKSKQAFEIKLNIKPFSVNEAWRGRKYKTPAYKNYEKALLCKLPHLDIPKPPYEVYYEFGFSNSLADIDNPVKPLQDILQKKYKFNDYEIYEIKIKKTIVKKGQEYFKVVFKNYK